MDLVSAVVLFSALAGATVGEGLTSSAPGAPIEAGWRMFTTITGRQACAAVPVPETMRADRVELSVGEKLAFDQIVVEAYGEYDTFIASVPIDIFDPDTANTSMAAVGEPIGSEYEARRHGTKVFHIRHYCGDAIGVLAELFVDVRNDGATFIDPHACPGEGCRYNLMYKATAPVTVYEQPKKAAAIAGVVKTGDVFLAMDGEVHTVPTPFIVDREHKNLKPGDEVLALTYSGEGWFRVYLNGDLTEADLDFSPSGGKTCNNDPQHCWGHLTRPHESTWWMRVITEDSLEGWVVADETMRAIDNRW